MPIPTIPTPTAQVLRTSKEPFAVINIVADVTAANAKLALYPVPSLAGGFWWPLWQFSYYFSAGTTKSATAVIHARDAQTGHWKALTQVAMVHEDAVTPLDSQAMQFEAPPQYDAFAVEIALDTADDRPHITMRGAAWCDVPVGVLS